MVGGDGGDVRDEGLVVGVIHEGDDHGVELGLVVELAVVLDSSGLEELHGQSGDELVAQLRGLVVDDRRYLVLHVLTCGEGLVDSFNVLGTVLLVPAREEIMELPLLDFLPLAALGLGVVLGGLVGVPLLLGDVDGFVDNVGLVRDEGLDFELWVLEQLGDSYAPQTSGTQLTQGRNGACWNLL